MASAFGHAFTAYALGKNFSSKLFHWKFWLLGILCSILPDADVIGFQFGISYGSFWGHRGFSHSFAFAFLISILFTILFFRKKTSIQSKIYTALYLFLCTASHGILDAFTNGGKGVALLSPFDDTRYFFPFQPILVSPIGVERFFSSWGMRVILSELLWIGIPCILLLFISKIKKHNEVKKN